ncbi:hypothetical protein [Actibacterium sp.]|uniref:hypothetical protein n=1 Tax=Actibacterium sp. TaxID=1872125 RepID=UPI0035628BD9
MDPDFLLVTGVVCGILAIPSLLNAYSESRPPRLAAMMFIAALVLIGLAVAKTPAPYRVADFPHVFAGVVARFLH